MSMQPQINAGLSQEKLYAAAKKAQLHAAQDPSKNDPSAQMVSQQTTGVKWQEVQTKNGKDLSLANSDAVYLSTISTALSADKVEAPLTASAAKPVNFKQKTIRALSEKLGKLFQDVFSHNFFVAELSKMGVGVIRFQLSMLGLSQDEIQDILSDARQEKVAAIDTGIRQVKSEEVLFSISTGAGIA